MQTLLPSAHARGLLHAVYTRVYAACIRYVFTGVRVHVVLLRNDVQSLTVMHSCGYSQTQEQCWEHKSLLKDGEGTSYAYSYILPCPLG